MDVLRAHAATVKPYVKPYRNRLPITVWPNCMGLPAITRGVLLSLAFLYAFVLPFICWGALAAPGHPHALPHLVFVDPPHLPASLHIATDCNDAAAHRDGTDSHAPAGRATPDTSAVSLLLLVALGALFTLPMGQQFDTESPRDHSGESTDDRVQTPPPRPRTESCWNHRIVHWPNVV